MVMSEFGRRGEFSLHSKATDLPQSSQILYFPLSACIVLSPRTTRLPFPATTPPPTFSSLLFPLVRVAVIYIGC